jgi:hypothetical protein
MLNNRQGKGSPAKTLKSAEHRYLASGLSL